jgi:hypothetical protein
MKKTLLITMLALSAGILVAGDALLKVNAEDGMAGFTGRNVKIVENARDGKKAFMAEKKGIIFTKETFKIDMEKSYVISVWVKAAGEPSFCWLGIAPCDAKRQYIQSHYVANVKGSLTELVAACKSGDTVVKIKDGSKWINQQYRVIAFGAKDDESDLPNRDVSSGIKNIEQKDGVYEVTLLKPLKKDYPAGTKVREHTMGGYVYAKKGRVPGEWTKWQGTVKGSSLRKGETGRLILLCNWGKDKDKDILFDELTIEEVDTPDK